MTEIVDAYVAQMSKMARWAEVDSKLSSAGCFLHMTHGEGEPLILRQWLVFPLMLQIKLWGEIIETRSVNICGNGADAVQKILDSMLSGAAYRVTDESAPEYQLASIAYGWFRDESVALLSRRAQGPHSCRPADWRCAKCGGQMIQMSADAYGWIHKCG